MLNNAREYELGFRCGMSGAGPHYVYVNGSPADVSPAFNHGFRDGRDTQAGFQKRNVADLQALASGFPATEVGEVIVYRNGGKVWLNPYG